MHRPGLSFLSVIKKLSYGILLFCGLTLLSSCSRESVEPEWEGPVIEMSVSCLEPTDPTKAGVSGVEAGENSYHENVLQWVDFYFYPGGATMEPATYHVRMTSGKRENDVFRIPLTTNQVNYLIFPVLSGITEATVLAIANGPKTLLDGLEDTSKDNIESQIVSTEFVNVTPTNHRQEQFMMSGTTTIELSSGGRSRKTVSQGLVNLVRYACKITVGLRMDDYVEVDTNRKDEDDNPIMERWTPRPQEMRIYLVDGIKRVALSGEPAGEGGSFTPAEEDYLSYSDNPMKFFNSNGELYLDKEGEFYQTFPMYTYPYHWVSGSIDEGTREPYLKLVLSWDRQEDTAHGISSIQREFYYKILIPQDLRGGDYLDSFVRNNWYHYDISVGVLGADTDEASIELPASLFIVYWQDKDVVVKQANIGNARYLSVEKEEYELYNQTSFDVRYISSNPIVLKDIHATRPYYGEDTTLGYNETYGGDVKKVSYSDTNYYDDIYPEGSYYLEFSEAQRIALNAGTIYEGKDWLQIETGYVRFYHKLNNNYKTDNFDYSPFTINFNMAHADVTETWMSEYDKHVTIVQNPGLFIKATPNPDTMEEGVPKNWGYVYVNNDQFTRARFEADPMHNDPDWMLEHIWRVVHYSSGGTDMYRIDVSVLPEDSEFVLGDPRQSTEDNLRSEEVYGEDTWAVAPDVNGVNRRLQHYYPTDASDRTKNMLAPAYRVSTKYSGSEYNGTPLEQAKMRCASLQENGFPAGRWRLPTLGEVRFISNLSAHGVFEWQFSGNYWSAHGAVKVDKANKTVTPVTVDHALLRCVYDSWYWGDDRVIDTDPDSENYGMPAIFTWGDAQR